MSKKLEAEAEKAEALASLREMLKPGDTVYCVLRHRAASGMSRVIDLLIAVDDYETIYPLKSADTAEYPGQRDYDAKPKRKRIGTRIRSIGWLAYKAGAGDGWDDKQSGIRIRGCGMDMGFEIVYRLGNRLWPEGTPKPHGTRNGQPDCYGGYALKSSWL